MTEHVYLTTARPAVQSFLRSLFESTSIVRFMAYSDDIDDHIHVLLGSGIMSVRSSVFASTTLIGQSLRGRDGQCKTMAVA
jgi:hypothetical protein